MDRIFFKIYLYIQTSYLPLFPKMKNESPFCSCLLYSANAFSRVIMRLAEKEFKPTGLPPSYAFLVMTVNNSPGILPTELSERLMLTPSTITRLIEKMEEQKLLERKISGKYTMVYPTKKSKALDVKLRTAWKEVYKKYSAALGEKESKSLTQKIYKSTKILETQNN